MTYLLSADPGLMTGLVLGEYTDDAPYKRLAYWQVAGGLSGFLEWYRSEPEGPLPEPWHWSYGNEGSLFHLPDLVVVAEKFVPLSGGGFSHTLKSVEPLRIEGAMIALGMIEDYSPESASWQRADKQYFCGGKTKAEKRKLSKQFLKDHGLYLTGKDVGQKDAEDVISAQLHSLAYMRKIGHEPTLKHYFSSERKGE